MAEYGVQDFANEAAQGSTEQRHGDYMGGSEAARGLLNSPDSFNDRLGGNPDMAMRQAIKNKHAGKFAMTQNRLSIDTMKGASQDHLKKLEVASQMAAEEYRMNFEKEMLRKKQAQASRMMRGQLVGQVLGIAGGVAGGVLGAGTGVGMAGGMIAGQQLGQGAGQAIGGGFE